MNRKSKFVKMKLVLLNIGFGLLICLQSFGNSDTVEVFSVKELQQDFNYLYRKLKLVHPDLNAQISEKQFKKNHKKVLSEIDKPLTELQFFKVVAPFLSSLYDGHTGVFPFGIKEFEAYRANGGKFFPFKLIQEKNKVVLAKTYDAKFVKGCEVLAINGSPINSILDSIAKYSFGDTYENQIRFATTAFLYYYKVIYGYEGPFNVEARYNNHEFEEEVLGLSFDEIKNHYKVDTSLNKAYTFKKIELPEINIAYLDMNRFSDRQEFKPFFEQKIKEINEDSIRNLIIDLRHNNGGDGNMVSDIFSVVADTSFCADLAGFSSGIITLSKEGRSFIRAALPSYLGFAPLVYKVFSGESQFSYQPKAYEPIRDVEFNGDVYVLVDKLSYSSSIALANLFKYYNRGLIIGEETEGRAKYITGPTELQLPNTGLEVSVSLMKLSSPVRNQDASRGVIPHYEVENTFIDASADDAVFNFTLNLITEKKKIVK